MFPTSQSKWGTINKARGLTPGFSCISTATMLLSERKEGDNMDKFWKFVRKIIALAFGIYAGYTSLMGVSSYLDEHGITEPSSIIRVAILISSLLILCFSYSGAEEFLEHIYGEKK